MFAADRGADRPRVEDHRVTANRHRRRRADAGGRGGAEVAAAKPAGGRHAALLRGARRGTQRRCGRGGRAVSTVPQAGRPGVGDRRPGGDRRARDPQRTAGRPQCGVRLQPERRQPARGQPHLEAVRPLVPRRGDAAQGRRRGGGSAARPDRGRGVGRPARDPLQRLLPLAARRGGRLPRTGAEDRDDRGGRRRLPPAGEGDDLQRGAGPPHRLGRVGPRIPRREDRRRGRRPADRRGAGAAREVPALRPLGPGRLGGRRQRAVLPQRPRQVLAARDRGQNGAGGRRRRQAHPARARRPPAILAQPALRRQRRAAAGGESRPGLPGRRPEADGQPGRRAPANERLEPAHPGGGRGAGAEDRRQPAPGGLPRPRRRPPAARGRTSTR